MYIFFDFETSSRSILGQILTYAFLVVDTDYKVRDRLEGKIRLNRTQLPDIDALLVNRIDIEAHQLESDTEWEAARRVFDFLNQQVAQYPFCKLVGFNSNRFDLQFLRNMLIRYGINPYFGGQIQPVDILQFAQHIAISHDSEFPWVLDESGRYYTFSLESLADRFGVLVGEQTHEAMDDVLLTIQLVQELEARYSVSLADFQAFCPHFEPMNQQEVEVSKQRHIAYTAEGESPEKVGDTAWMKLFAGKKDIVALNLDRYGDHEQDPLPAIRYINANKHYFVSTPLESDDRRRYEATIQSALENPFLRTLSRSRYFELIKKDWDIEYQIHELGFDHIPRLHAEVESFMEDPGRYMEIMGRLVPNINTDKDKYMVQLFNRIYLNYHPDPNPEHVSRYCIPRYVTGDMIRPGDDFVSFSEYRSDLASRLEANEHSEEDMQLLRALAVYTDAFASATGLDRSTEQLTLI